MKVLLSYCTVCSGGIGSRGREVKQLTKDQITYEEAQKWALKPCGVLESVIPVVEDASRLL